MDRPDKLTVTISGDQAERIRTSVANGDYASADDFVAAAIDNYDDMPDWLPDNDTLRRLIAEALDDPRPSLTSEQVRENIDRWTAEAEAEEAARRKAG